MVLGTILKERRISYLILFFSLLYAIISLVNHFLFRTYALDLGVYTNALWDYRHFQFNDSTTFKTLPENLLADHFDLYLIILSPLSILFGTYTLLIVQIFFLIIGGIGVYNFFYSSEKKTIGLYACAFFFSFFGVFSAVSFDYHSNVIAACIMPWFIVSINKHKQKQALIFFILILIAKENMSLWLLFVCLGLLIEHRNHKPTKNFLLLLATLALFYFILILSVVMPAFSNQSHYNHFDYAVLGSNMTEATKTLLLHPWSSLKLLVVNTTTNPKNDFIKLEFIVLICITGLPLLIKKPGYLLMTFPLILQKFFNDNPNKWGIVGQYSIEFAPVLAIGLFSFINSLESNKNALLMARVILSMSVISTIRTMDSTIMWTEKNKIRFYQLSHYTKDYNFMEAHKIIELIPHDAIVSAQSPFLPHLALRDKIYQFPTINDAEYIVFSEKENSYPLSRTDFNRYIENLMKSPDFEVLSSEPLVVLKKTVHH